MFDGPNAHLVDSDVIIDVLADDPVALRILNDLAAGDLALSMVSFMEVTQGILESSDNVGAQKNFDRFLAKEMILPFSRSIALRCARLRSELKREGRRVRQRSVDLTTAATALAYGMPLVTRNIADHEDIPGLSRYGF